MTKEERIIRNQAIVEKHRQGVSTQSLAETYGLTPASIRKIIEINDPDFLKNCGFKDETPDGGSWIGQVQMMCTKPDEKMSEIAALCTRYPEAKHVFEGDCFVNNPESWTKIRNLAYDMCMTNHSVEFRRYGYQGFTEEYGKYPNIVNMKTFTSGGTVEKKKISPPVYLFLTKPYPYKLRRKDMFLLCYTNGAIALNAPPSKQDIEFADFLRELGLHT